MGGGEEGVMVGVVGFALQKGGSRVHHKNKKFTSRGEG